MGLTVLDMVVGKGAGVSSTKEVVLGGRHYPQRTEQHLFKILPCSAFPRIPLEACRASHNSRTTWVNDTEGHFAPTERGEKNYL